MTDVEYVAVVRVERVERRLVPRGTAVNPRRTTTEDRLVRDKAEVLAFTVRASQPHQVKSMVREMMQAGMIGAESIPADPETDDEEEEDV